eukprot:3267749-Rhodomonas_salina.5
MRTKISGGGFEIWIEAQCWGRREGGSRLPHLPTQWEGVKVKTAGCTVALRTVQYVLLSANARAMRCLGLTWRMVRPRRCGPQRRNHGRGRKIKRSRRCTTSMSRYALAL